MPRAAKSAKGKARATRSKQEGEQPETGTSTPGPVSAKEGKARATRSKQEGEQPETGTSTPEPVSAKEDIIPSIGSETGEKDVETPKTIATSPEKSPKKGKKKPSNSKGKKKADELQTTSISPLADVILEEEKELPGKKKANKRKSTTSTVQKTTRKRTKRSVEEGNLQKPVTLPSGDASITAPKDKVQAGDSKIEEQGTEMPETVATSKQKNRKRSKGSKKEAQAAEQPKTVLATTGHVSMEEEQMQSKDPGTVEQDIKTEKITVSPLGESSKKEEMKSDVKAVKTIVAEQPTSISPPVKTTTKKGKIQPRGETAQQKDVDPQDTITTLEKTCGNDSEKQETVSYAADSTTTEPKDLEAQGSSAEAAGGVENISALQQLWETTAAAELEEMVQHGDSDISDQPIPGGQAVSAADLPSSTFMAELRTIQCTSLQFGEEVIPVYFGDFSVHEVLMSYDPKNVPMEEENNREPEPATAEPAAAEPAAAEPAAAEPAAADPTAADPTAAGHRPDEPTGN